MVVCTVCVFVCTLCVCTVCVDDLSPLSSLPVQYPSFLLPLSRPKRSPPICLHLLWCFCGVSTVLVLVLLCFFGVSVALMWCFCG